MFIKIVTICFYLFLFLYLIPVPALGPFNAVAGGIAGVCSLILCVMAMQ